MIGNWPHTYIVFGYLYDAVKNGQTKGLVEMKESRSIGIKTFIIGYLIGILCVYVEMYQSIWLKSSLLFLVH